MVVTSAPVICPISWSISQEAATRTAPMMAYCKILRAASVFLGSPRD